MTYLISNDAMSCWNRDEKSELQKWFSVSFFAQLMHIDQPTDQKYAPGNTSVISISWLILL